MGYNQTMPIIEQLKMKLDWLKADWKVAHACKQMANERFDAVDRHLRLLEEQLRLELESQPNLKTPRVDNLDSPS